MRKHFERDGDEKKDIEQQIIIIRALCIYLQFVYEYLREKSVH